MNALFLKHKWLQIIYGTLLLVAGILIIVMSINQPESITIWISVIFAIGLFIFGACSIMAGVFTLEKKFFNSLFIVGSLSIAFGVVLCTLAAGKDTDLMGNLIKVFFSVMLLAMGAVECGEAAAMIYFKRSKFAIAIFFVLGALFIAAGVLTLIFWDNIIKVVYAILGGLIALLGLFEMVVGVISFIGAKKAEKEVDDLVKEAEQKSQEDNKEADVVDTQSSEQVN